MRKILLLAAFLIGLRANSQVVPIPKDVLQRAYDSTVVLTAHTDEGDGVCSATIVGRTDSTYKILSAAHCVGDVQMDISFSGGESEDTMDADMSLAVNFDSRFSVEPETDSGWKAHAKLLTVGNFDAGLDYSVLSFNYASDQSLPVSAMDGEPLEVGDGVFNVSAPLNHTKTPLFGVVTKLDTEFSVWKHALLLQMPGAAPGSSGSAVFDAQGRIRAIIVAGDDENPSLVVALPVSEILAGTL